MRHRFQTLLMLVFGVIAIAIVLVATTASGDDGRAAASSLLNARPATTLPDAGADPATAKSPSDDRSGTSESAQANRVHAPGTEAAAAAPETPPVAVDVHPVRVRIPGIDVDADIVDLGLNADGTLEVPTDYGVTGWYTGRAAPGEVGPSVVVGHVDSESGPAVFFRLRDLDTGDMVSIDRSDGLVAWYRVDEVRLVDKGEFPTELVYGPADEPTLRLITCGGAFDAGERSYLGNLLVFADHVGNYPSQPDSPQA